MRKYKYGLAFAIVVGILNIGSRAWSAAWTLPNNMKVVQTSGNGTNTYATIAAALDSITNNSASNRYLVKVLPGTYVQATPLQMKPYVDIEGSGQENTVISATNIPMDPDWWSGTPQTRATVVMASNMTLSNLRVQNNTPTTGMGILITQPSAIVENVTVDASGPGDCSVYYNMYLGIGVRNTATDIVLKDVTATATWTNACDCDGAFAINAGGTTRVSVIGSKAVAKGGAYPIGIEVGNIESNVRDSYGEAGPTTSIQGGSVNGIMGASSVTNSEGYAHDAFDCKGINTGGTIEHSKGRARNFTTGGGIIGGGSTNVAASLIEGGYFGVSRVTACWDENFVPIAYP